jgi:hypothetical protein
MSLYYFDRVSGTHSDNHTLTVTRLSDPSSSRRLIETHHYGHITSRRRWHHEKSRCRRCILQSSPSDLRSHFIFDHKPLNLRTAHLQPDSIIATTTPREIVASLLHIPPNTPNTSGPQIVLTPSNCFPSPTFRASIPMHGLSERRLRSRNTDTTQRRCNSLRHCGHFPSPFDIVPSQRHVSPSNSCPIAYNPNHNQIRVLTPIRPPSSHDAVFFLNHPPSSPHLSQTFIDQSQSST